MNFEKNIHGKEINLDLFFNLNWNEWLAFNISLHQNWFALFTVVIWHIWIYRNKAIFEQSMLNAYPFFNKLCFYDLALTNHAFQKASNRAVLKILGPRF